MERRVVITGTGLVTPVGIGVQESWDALCAGVSGIGPITRFDAELLHTKIAGEVKGFNPEDHLPKKEARRTELFIAYSIAAARMALEDSGFKLTDQNRSRVGVFTGCGLGGLDVLTQSLRLIDKGKPTRVSPFSIPMMIGNMAPGMISIHMGAQGPNCSVATACAAGNHAIGSSYNIIKSGDADAMFTGGVEAVIAAPCIAGFNSMKALSRRNDDPQRASRPFDRDRDGFVVGEGAGILFLETLESALNRGATIYAEVLGFGMSGDAVHMTAPSSDGAARCMQMALDNAGLKPDNVDYINAHGTSTSLNDISETKAVKQVFGDFAYKIPISSTKSMTGHLLGGAGGIEGVITALTIKDGVIPPTINLDNPGEECDLDYVPGVKRKKDVNIAMTNSFGFGGTNASLILGRVDGK